MSTINLISCDNISIIFNYLEACDQANLRSACKRMNGIWARNLPTLDAGVELMEYARRENISLNISSPGPERVIGAFQNLLGGQSGNFTTPEAKRLGGSGVTNTPARRHLDFSGTAPLSYPFIRTNMLEKQAQLDAQLIHFANIFSQRAVRSREVVEDDGVHTVHITGIARLQTLLMDFEPDLTNEQKAQAIRQWFLSNHDRLDLLEGIEDDESSPVDSYPPEILNLTSIAPDFAVDIFLTSVTAKDILVVRRFIQSDHFAKCKGENLELAISWISTDENKSDLSSDILKDIISSSKFNLIGDESINECFEEIKNNPALLKIFKNVGGLSRVTDENIKNGFLEAIKKGDEGIFDLLLEEYMNRSIDVPVKDFAYVLNKGRSIRMVDRLLNGYNAPLDLIKNILAWDFSKGNDNFKEFLLKTLEFYKDTSGK